MSAQTPYLEVDAIGVFPTMFLYLVMLLTVLGIVAHVGVRLSPAPPPRSPRNPAGTGGVSCVQDRRAGRSASALARREDADRDVGRGAAHDRGELVARRRRTARAITRRSPAG